MVESQIDLSLIDANKRHAFFANQLSVGYFSTTRVTLKLIVLDESQSIVLEEGVSSKISKRRFLISELHQIVLAPVDAHTQSKSPTKVKVMSLVFRVRKFCCVTYRCRIRVFSQSLVKLKNRFFRNFKMQ
jgi:hypothetical protein